MAIAPADKKKKLVVLLVCDVYSGCKYPFGGNHIACDLTLCRPCSVHSGSVSDQPVVSSLL